MSIMMNRRQLLQYGAGAAVAAFAARGGGFGARPAGASFHGAPLQDRGGAKIDRRALVTRHNIVRDVINDTAPLQVGNGTFAFGADITGLQTFTRFNTLSDWGWHAFPMPPGQTPADFRGAPWDAHGRPVLYGSPSKEQPELGKWMYENPHRINIGRIALSLTTRDGRDASVADIADIHQVLDLWSGTLRSDFTLDGQPVHVETCASPSLDAVAVRIQSPLIAAGRLALYVDFPYDDGIEFNRHVGDFVDEEKHQTTVERQDPQRTDILHVLDSTSYHTAIAWQTGATLDLPVATPAAAALTIVSAKYGAADKWADVTALLTAAIKSGRIDMQITNVTMGGDPALGHSKALDIVYKVGDETLKAHIGEANPLRIGPPSRAHRFTLKGQADHLDALIAFSPQRLPPALPTPAETFEASAKSWEAYWLSGAAIDLSESKDERWRELERRIVLSQYLMRVNEAGTLPPQESGYVNNGWEGKFHMEMYWWHAAHWALWNRWPELDKSLDVYERFLASSKDRAKHQGYRGARWPKMTGPEGWDSVHPCNAMLAWQQPHPMFFAELDYRAHPTRETLDKWREVLFETADFMASYAYWDEPSKRFVLGPPMYVVSENTDPKITINPAFELSYWRFGLRIAQTWRERLGLKRDADWENVLQNLSPLPMQDGVYVLYEGVPNMWTHYNYEHPALTGVYGWLPGDGVDVEVERRTADKIFATWNMKHVWGWDLPMMAMCTARLGDPAKSVALLADDNSQFNFDDAGLSTGGPYPYFPSNGGLLYAVAMMAAGWDGAPNRHAPGFPQDGSWTVRWEGLSRAL
ncbi:MAG: hypothetical protein P4L33_11085 [Capsulimonadaceae bacterium]|nr:hypothetical protein [Capsulimonadaceae bacterium]